MNRLDTDFSLIRYIMKEFNRLRKTQNSQEFAKTQVAISSLSLLLIAAIRTASSQESKKVKELRKKLGLTDETLQQHVSLPPLRHSEQRAFEEDDYKGNSAFADGDSLSIAILKAVLNFTDNRLEREEEIRTYISEELSVSVRSNKNSLQTFLLLLLSISNDVMLHMIDPVTDKRIPLFKPDIDRHIDENKKRIAALNVLKNNIGTQAHYIDRSGSGDHGNQTISIELSASTAVQETVHRVGAISKETMVFKMRPASDQELYAYIFGLHNENYPVDDETAQKFRDLKAELDIADADWSEETGCKLEFLTNINQAIKIDFPLLAHLLCIAIDDTPAKSDEFAKKYQTATEIVMGTPRNIVYLLSAIYRAIIFSSQEGTTTQSQLYEQKTIDQTIIEKIEQTLGINVGTWTQVIVNESINELSEQMIEQIIKEAKEIIRGFLRYIKTQKSKKSATT